MSFEYVDEILELKYQGQSYSFRAPSALEQKQIAKDFKNASEETDVIEMYVSFFVQLGLPKEVLEKMSVKGIVDLFSYAVGSKKN